MLIRILAAVVLLAVVGFLALRLLIPRISPKPDNLGVMDGRLAPCPDSPNCVNTFSTDAQHAIAPIPYTIPTEEARAALISAIEAMPGGTLITAEPTYLYAEFRTPLMGYIDDSEFLLDEAAGLIHFRSASRLGQGDLGVNRKRMEGIRERIAEAVSR